MTCAVHSDRDAAAYCRNCGRALCLDCKRDLRGMIYCEDCLVAQIQGQPVPPAYPTAPPAPGGPSPGLALFLGFIPGVGAIYNGQFAKAFLHLVIFGILCSLAGAEHIQGFEPLFGLLAFGFWAYMAGEAYHTAKKRQMGQPVDQWSGLLPSGSRLQGAGGAIALILVGVVFLLDTLDIVPLARLLRYWPVLLIAAGLLMLFQRLGSKPEQPPL